MVSSFLKINQRSKHLKRKLDSIAFKKSAHYPISFCVERKVSYQRGTLPVAQLSSFRPKYNSALVKCLPYWEFVLELSLQILL